MSHMIVFDDRDFVHHSKWAPDWGPITDLRATFEVRSGMVTTLERLAWIWNDQPISVWVPDSLADIVSERCPYPVNDLESIDNEMIFLANGRWTWPVAGFEIGPGQALVEQETGGLIAAHVDSATVSELFETGMLPGHVEQIGYDGQMLIGRPWELIGGLPRILRSDLLRTIDLMGLSNSDMADSLSRLKSQGVTIIGDEPIGVDPSAKVYPSVVLEAENGPIFIDEDAVVRPGSILVGPVYVGRRSMVLDRALIKENTSIGPRCKVTGEVSATIFQGYANKGHDGHLGHSYIGEWVNIGAGATNSNLLNTYGEIPMRLSKDRPRERTGMQYLGSIIGDHVKLAINTRLMTGTVIGTGAMIATTAAPPTTVEPFGWLTDAGTRRFQIGKFLDVAQTVMHRRDQELTPAIEQRLRALHEMATNST